MTTRTRSLGRDLFGLQRTSKRFTTLVAVLVAAVTAYVGHRTLRAQDAPPASQVTLSMATLAPPGSTWMRVFDAWNREVRRRSNRGLQLRFYSGGVQGEESEVIRKIRGGRLDGAGVTAVGLAQIHRPALVFMLPSMFRGYAQLDAARTALNDEMTRGFESAGFKFLGWADVGQTRIFSTQPIRVPGDLAQRRPWVWRDDAIQPVLFQNAIRTNPVVLQVPEVLGALQTNRIDTVLASPTAAVALQWSSRIAHMTDYDISISIGGSVISKARFDALSAEHQTILRETGEQFHSLMRRNLRADERTSITAITSRNVATVTLTPQQRAEWDRVATDVRTRLTGQIADAALIQRARAAN